MYISKSPQFNTLVLYPSQCPVVMYPSQYPSCGVVSSSGLLGFPLLLSILLTPITKQRQIQNK